MTDLVGDTHAVLCVKGSGWDMGTIEPAGLPAVKIDALLKSRKLDKLSDEDMVTLLRANLIDPAAPNPSVEALLHAFLPHKFIDHTHSTAILAIADQAESQKMSTELFGKKMGFVPYIMPGFALAKAAAEVFEQDPTVECLILDKHGIFTFGDTAKAAYGRMIHYVTVAEDHVRNHGRNPFTPIVLPASLASAGDITSMLRGAVAVDKGEGRYDRMVSVFRASPAILDFVNAREVADMAARGVSTPDLSIRIKTGPMVLPAPTTDDLAGYRAVIDQHVATFVADYTEYFRSNDARDDVKRTMLDPMPRLTLVPGLGMFGHGRTFKDATIAVDVGEMWIEAARDAESVGRFEPVSRPDLFDLEYWSLEQAKLAGAKPKPFTGQVAVVTGGAGPSVLPSSRPLQPRALMSLRSISMARRLRRLRRLLETVPSASPATSPIPHLYELPLTRQSQHLAASILWCQMLAQPGKALLPRWTTRCCARASSSISSLIRPSHKMPCAS